ncbi:MAG: ATP-grasp domain-containing protein [Candidatus Hydrogenedentes bacterium]|nr:ATP-grasp domain-containing protein [Candidatus Hydrogenedentota bacterium]
MAKRIIIAGSPQPDLLRAAAEIGLQPIVLNPQGDGGDSSVNAAAVSGDSTSPEAIKGLAIAEDAVGVVASIEESVQAVAQAASELGLPGVSPWAATRTRNKVALRQALAAKGFPNPPYREVITEEQAEESARAIGLPVIVKPADGYACQGVRFVDQIEEVSLAFTMAAKHSALGVVIVEEVMLGDEYSVEGIKVDGEYHVFGITRRIRSQSIHPYATGLLVPANVSTTAQGALIATARAALTAIGMKTGPAHVEMILTDKGPQIIEIGAYLGAARIESALIRLAYGIDCLAGCLRVAIGEAPRLKPCVDRAAAASWIPSPSGIIAAVEGVEEARSLPGVAAVRVNAQPGEKVGHITDCRSRDRIGWVVATGANAEEALATAVRGRDRCRVVTRSTT